MEGRVKIIAVAGGSGSGKTLFTRFLTEKLPKSVVLPLDQYYLDKPDEIPVEQYDFDVPQALDFKLYRKDLDELIAGNPIRMPQFEYVVAKRRREFIKVLPGDYLILEGLYVLMHASIRSMLSYSFFLESPYCASNGNQPGKFRGIGSPEVHLTIFLLQHGSPLFPMHLRVGRTQKGSLQKASFHPHQRPPQH